MQRLPFASANGLKLLAGKVAHVTQGSAPGYCAGWYATRPSSWRVHRRPSLAGMELGTVGAAETKTLEHFIDSVFDRTCLRYSLRFRGDLCDRVLKLAWRKFSESLRQSDIHEDLSARSLALSRRNRDWCLRSRRT